MWLPSSQGTSDVSDGQTDLYQMAAQRKKNRFAFESPPVHFTQ